MRVTQRVFESASEMLVRPRVYWGEVPGGPAHLQDSAVRRWDLVRAAVNSLQFGGAWSVFGGPTRCLDEVLERAHINNEPASTTG